MSQYCRCWTPHFLENPLFWVKDSLQKYCFKKTSKARWRVPQPSTSASNHLHSNPTQKHLKQATRARYLTQAEYKPVPQLPFIYVNLVHHCWPNNEAAVLRNSGRSLLQSSSKQRWIHVFYYPRSSLLFSECLKQDYDVQADWKQ